MTPEIKARLLLWQNALDDAGHTLRLLLKLRHEVSAPVAHLTPVDQLALYEDSDWRHAGLGRQEIETVLSALECKALIDIHTVFGLTDKGGTGIAAAKDPGLSTLRANLVNGASDEAGLDADLVTATLAAARDRRNKRIAHRSGEGVTSRQLPNRLIEELAAMGGEVGPVFEYRDQKPVDLSILLEFCDAATTWLDPLIWSSESGS